MTEHIGNRVRQLVFRLAADLSRRERFVLDALADRANCSGECFPSHADLAAGSGYSTRTIRRAITELRRRGFLTATPRFNATTGARTSDLFTLQFEQIAALPRRSRRPRAPDAVTPHRRPPAKMARGGRPPWPEVPETMATSPGHHGHISSQREPPTEAPNTGGAPAPTEAQERLWLEFLNSETGGSFRPVEANLRPIRARLREGRTLEEARAVVADRVRRWKGTELAQYLRPITLYGPKFDGYLQAARNGNDRTMPSPVMARNSEAARLAVGLVERRVGR